ncbi:MAG: hypothetical protein WC554_17440 [Clostridia bacterium]
MIKLKACPFCGLIIHDPNGIEKTCECPNDMDHMSRALWNNRPIEDALRSENERLREAIEKIDENHWKDNYPYWIHEAIQSALNGGK